MSISQLAREIAESPTLKLNEEAADLKDRGESVIHLGAGEPKLVARPEDLSLAAPAPVQPNAVPGQVLRRQFLGAKTVYRVRLRAGAELFVEQHAGSAAGAFHPGDPVQVLLPARCRVVAG